NSAMAVLPRGVRVTTFAPLGRTAIAEFAPRLHTVLDDTIHQVLSADEIETLVELLNRIEQSAETCVHDPA
ncbi:MAG: hypothetical protein AAGK32_19405, partial [Actinomycetota bacterium]